MKTIRFIAAGMLMLVIAACQTINPGLASADAQLRDKCAYLISGVGIARLAATFAPQAAPVVEQGALLIDAYCGSKPVTDVASAMAAMERIIVAVRPLAAQVKQ